MDNQEVEEEETCALSEALEGADAREVLQQRICDGKTTIKKRAKGKKPAKYKKNPDAPKRFRSAFIIFSQKKHREIHEKLKQRGEEKDTINIAKLVSEEWRAMKPTDRKIWEKKAQQDKVRYMAEKAEYKGPWKILANKRLPKDPSSPKKPVPAYFAFSNARRQKVKSDNPSASNAEISGILSNMWKEAPEAIRKVYVEEEASRRQEYAVEMEKWRRKTALAKKKRQEQKESNRIARMQREASPSYDGRPDESGVISASSNLSSSASKTMPEPSSRDSTRELLSIRSNLEMPSSTTGTYASQSSSSNRTLTSQMSIASAALPNLDVGALLLRLLQQQVTNQEQIASSNLAALTTQAGYSNLLCQLQALNGANNNLTTLGLSSMLSSLVNQNALTSYHLPSQTGAAGQNIPAFLNHALSANANLCVANPNGIVGQQPGTPIPNPNSEKN